MKFNKPRISFPGQDPFDPRIGSILGSRLTDPSKPRLVIVGFPSDTGVTRNNGRPGAARGPEAIRSMLYKMTPDADNHKTFNSILQLTLDLGDLEVHGDLDRDQETLGRVLVPYLSKNIPVIVLGGGHETAYGHFLGYVQSGKKTGILNWDAHTDVREKKGGKGHSGSPFRQSLEHPSGICRDYKVAGLQPHSVATTHLQWLKEKSCRYFFAEQVTESFVKGMYGALDHSYFVTFDLDAVDQAFAPGVSAPAVSGLNTDLWLTAAFEAGINPEISSIDISELNPDYDIDNRTARLAAKTVWMFIRGLAERVS